MDDRAEAVRRAVQRHRRTHLDAVTLLSVYLVLLFCLESRWVVGPLGGAGNPALMVACTGFGWWVFHHVRRPRATGYGRQPVRIALLVLFAAFLLSFAAAMARPISAVENGTAHLGMVTVVGWLGVALVANDGIPTLARWRRVVALLVVLVSGLALLGIAQFVTGQSLVRWISIPGLSTVVPLGDLQSRSGFVRPAGTALHPIEFGAVLTTLLPLTLAHARNRARAGVPWWWISPVLIGLGVVVSISRSAVLCAVVALVIGSWTWSRGARRVLGAGVLAVLAFVAVMIPGMLGSLGGLFVSAGADNSVASRTGSYPIAADFLERSPLLGRGFSTFLPSYRIFDNQYLLLVIETGLVGLGCFLGLLLTALWVARTVRVSAVDRATREYAQALLAGVASAAVGLALFDGLSFPMSTGVLFCIIGLTGALLRLVRDGETRLELGSPPRVAGHDRLPLIRPAGSTRSALVLLPLTALLLGACTSAGSPPDPEARPTATSDASGTPERTWPDASSTGAMGPLVRREGGVLDEPGTTVAGVEYSGQVTIDADDVVLRNVVIRSNGPYGVLVSGRRAVLENVTLVGGPETSALLAADGAGQFTARRIDASGAEDGVRLGNGSVLSESYVHSLRPGPDAHNDAVTADGARGWEITGNTIVNPHAQTAAVWVGDARYGATEGLLSGNLLAGGGYTIYAGPGTGQGIRVVDNAFSTRYFATAGRHGPTTGWVEDGNTWDTNVWLDGPRAGAPVRP